MEWYFAGSGILALLVLFIMIGIPIPFALVAASLPFLLPIQGLYTSIVSTQLTMWGTWFNYSMLALPLFIFLGELVARSEIGHRLYQIMHQGIRVRGSAMYGTIGASAAFGAICGSSVVGSLTIGGVALPQMFKLKYSKRMAAGAVAAGGTLSVLIPPSNILLYYGIVTDTSIGKLFIAGVIPGLVLTGFFMVTVFVWWLIQPSSIPVAERLGSLTVRYVLIGLTPIIIIGFIVTASIYFGIATPTEAAALASVVTTIIAFSIGGMTPRGFLEALLGTLRTMGYLGFLLAGAFMFGFVLNYYRVPQEFTQVFAALNLESYAVLLFALAFYLFLGMFMEAASMTFITLPILFPLVSAAGYDPIWFGIIYTLLIEIACLTPPVGLNIYVLQGLAPKELSFSDIVYGCLPFVAALLVMIALLIGFPEIALFLPNNMN